MPGGNRQDADKDVFMPRGMRKGQEQAGACNWQDADRDVDLARLRRMRRRAMSFLRRMIGGGLSWSG